MNGKKFGVNIIYIRRKNPLGTAGPLRAAKQYLTETFVMCNSDELKILIWMTCLHIIKPIKVALQLL